MVVLSKKKKVLVFDFEKKKFFFVKFLCYKDFHFISNLHFGYFSFSNLFLGYNNLKLKTQTDNKSNHPKTYTLINFVTLIFWLNPFTIKLFFFVLNMQNYVLSFKGWNEKEIQPMFQW